MLPGLRRQEDRHAIVYRMDHFNESPAWRTVCDIPPEAGCAKAQKDGTIGKKILEPAPIPNLFFFLSSGSLRLLGGIAVSSCRASACNLKRNNTYFMMKNFRENDGDLCRP